MCSHGIQHSESGVLDGHALVSVVHHQSFVSHRLARPPYLAHAYPPFVAYHDPNRQVILQEAVQTAVDSSNAALHAFAKKHRCVSGTRWVGRSRSLMKATSMHSCAQRASENSQTSLEVGMNQTGEVSELCARNPMFLRRFIRYVLAPYFTCASTRQHT